jgi:transcriptional regulator with XRE-family HTH domain
MFTVPNLHLLGKENIQKENYNLLIGQNIRKWRELKGIKQELLANHLGITKGALSNIENNKTDISLRRIEQIAVCLGIEVMLLFVNPLDLILPPPPPPRIKHKILKVKAA